MIELRLIDWIIVCTSNESEKLHQLRHLANVLVIWFLYSELFFESVSSFFFQRTAISKLAIISNLEMSK